MEFKETDEALTLHGLGFLQLKLSGHQRLHIWHPELPRRKCAMYSQIHDHRFAFRSRVLVGIQVNTVYRFELAHLDATHKAYRHDGERTKFGNRPWTFDHYLKPIPCYTETIKPGHEYLMAPYVYHSTHPGGDGRVATVDDQDIRGGPRCPLAM